MAQSPLEALDRTWTHRVATAPGPWLFDCGYGWACMVVYRWCFPRADRCAHRGNRALPVMSGTQCHRRLYAVPL